MVVNTCLCSKCRVIIEAEHLTHDDEQFFRNFHCFMSAWWYIPLSYWVIAAAQWYHNMIHSIISTKTSLIILFVWRPVLLSLSFLELITLESPKIFIHKLYSLKCVCKWSIVINSFVFWVTLSHLSVSFVLLAFSLYDVILCMILTHFHIFRTLNRIQLNDSVFK